MLCVRTCTDLNAYIYMYVCIYIHIYVLCNHNCSNWELSLTCKAVNAHTERDRQSSDESACDGGVIQLCNSGELVRS